jgi:hypothetical protein
MAIRKIILRLLRIGALLLGVLALSFLSGCWNWFVEKQVFFPDTTIAQTPADIGLPFEDIWFTSSDSVRLHGWLIPASPSNHIFLFCHGNAGNISHRLDNVRLLNQRGISVFIFDYRGYGRSDGRISEPTRWPESGLTNTRPSWLFLGDRWEVLPLLMSGLPRIVVGSSLNQLLRTWEPWRELTTPYPLRNAYSNTV